MLNDFYEKAKVFTSANNNLEDVAFYMIKTRIFDRGDLRIVEGFLDNELSKIADVNNLSNTKFDIVAIVEDVLLGKRTETLEGAIISPITTSDDKIEIRAPLKPKKQITLGVT